jgi:hypothetical protein
MVAPSRFCHVVYKTHHYNEMIEWYPKVFEARIQHRGDRLSLDLPRPFSPAPRSFRAPNSARTSSPTWKVLSYL